MNPPTSPSTALEPAALAEHVDFLRALARQLVRDEHEAEDLAQEALLVGTQQGGTSVRAARAWLAGVLRHRAADRRATAGRRAERERIAARPEATLDDAASMEARLETQRLLAEAVQALAEPYRSVIFQRFFEELPPRRIAARLGLPVETRLRRGLQLLRARLDAASGGRRDVWCAALVGLLRPQPPRPLPPGLAPAARLLGSGALMSWKIWTVSAALLAACMWWGWGGTSDGLAAPVEEAAHVPGPARTAASPARAAPVEGARARIAQALPEPATGEPAVGPARGWRIHGRIVDEDGVGVPEVKVRYGFPPFLGGALVDAHELTTDADGAFEGDALLHPTLSRHAPVWLRLEAVAPDGRTASWGGRSFDPRRSPLGGRVDVGDTALRPLEGDDPFGRVLDTRGEPVANVPVRAFVGELELYTSRKTREEGGFHVLLGLHPRPAAWPERLDAVRAVVGSELSGFVEYPPFDYEAEGGKDLGEITLPARGRLEGALRFPDGDPADDVPLWLLAADDLGRSEAPSRELRTDAQGRFRATALTPGEYLVFTERPDPRSRQSPFGPFHTGEFARLELDRYRLTLRVVDEQGGAVPDVSLVGQSDRGGHVHTTRFGEYGVGRLWVRPGLWRFVAQLDPSNAGTDQASAPDTVWGRGEVLIAEGDHDSEAELVLAFDRARGDVHIDVRDDLGRPVSATARLSLFLEGPEPSTSLQLRSDEEGLVRGVPAGRYRVQVSPAAGVAGAYFGEQEQQRLEVIEGLTGTVTTRWMRGGWLRLRVEIDDEDGPRPVTVSATRPGEERPRELGFARANAAGTRTRYARSARVGVWQRSGLLRPGTHDLVVTAEGCASVERRVEILAGEERTLQLVLRPER